MELVTDRAIEGIDFDRLFGLNVSFTVDTISGGRFTREMAEYIARQDKSKVRDAAGKIVADYR
jgi:hypothetical protein